VSTRCKEIAVRRSRAPSTVPGLVLEFRRSAMTLPKLSGNFLDRRKLPLVTRRERTAQIQISWPVTIELGNRIAHSREQPRLPVTIGSVTPWSGRPRQSRGFQLPLLLLHLACVLGINSAAKRSLCGGPSTFEACRSAISQTDLRIRRALVAALRLATDNCAPSF